MSMKPKKTIGIFGIVAVAAILSVSLVTSGVGSQSATAAAANKFAYTEDEATVLAQWTSGQTIQTTNATVGPMVVKSSDKGDWHVTFTGECATASEAKATGKKGSSSDTSGAIAGAQVQLIVDKGTDSERELHDWLFCEHDLQIEADLNALIEYNATSDALEFVCDEPDADLSDACWQWVAVYSSVAGSYHAEWIVEDLDSGDHTFEIAISAEAGPSGDTTDAALEDEPNGVESMVMLSHKVVVADTVHLANPNADPNS